jgi:multiple sugar transport system permease protein
MQPPAKRKATSRATAITSSRLAAPAPFPASRSTARRRRRTARHASTWLFLLPSFIVLAAVLLFPLGYALYLSVLNYDLGAGTDQFIGAANYTALLGEARFWESLRRTIVIVGCAVTLEFSLGLLVAYGLYRLTFGARTLNLLMFLPSVITPVVAALFLRWIFIGRWGLLPGILISLGIFPPDFLGSPGWARVTVVLADSWQFTPFMILVLYAGLNTVDQSQIEAAQIDGAGPWMQLFRIMVPSIKPLIMFVLAIRLMDAFRFFDLIYVLTAGGPGTATETITMYTYSLAFRLLQVGKASALGVLTLLFVAGMIALLIGVMYRREKGAF